VRLAVPVDAPHPLFESIGVPRNVVIYEEVAKLKIDALARRFSGNQDLNGTFLELLFGKQTSSRLFARSDLHASVNGAHLEAHVLELLNDVVERVLVFGEHQKPLVAVSEEAFVFEEASQLRELRFGVSVFDGLGRFCKTVEFLNLRPNLIGVSGQCDGVQQALAPARSPQALPSQMDPGCPVVLLSPVSRRV
jgi:hypothetical protein